MDFSPATFYIFILQQTNMPRIGLFPERIWIQNPFILCC